MIAARQHLNGAARSSDGALILARLIAIRFAMDAATALLLEAAADVGTALARLRASIPAAEAIP